MNQIDSEDEFFKRNENLKFTQLPSKEIFATAHYDYCMITEKLLETRNSFLRNFWATTMSVSFKKSEDRSTIKNLLISFEDFSDFLNKVLRQISELHLL